jgi:ribA/ribD-fused uncharacterized protein
MPTRNHPLERWKLNEFSWFRRTDDALGDFSNFANQMPIRIHGFRVRSSEHLYQAMRFPHLPDTQLAILDADSPKTAKTIAQKEDLETRDDWIEIRVDVMRWVLSRKIQNNAKRMGKAFALSESYPIVEFSKRDTFWGAQPTEEDSNTVVGQNVLGCLLTELRSIWRQDRLLRDESKPRFSRAVLLGEPV